MNLNSKNGNSEKYGNIFYLLRSFDDPGFRSKVCFADLHAFNVNIALELSYVVVAYRGIDCYK